jgi:methionyl aminopeptidase
MFGRHRLDTKTPDQIRLMRRAGLVVGETLALMRERTAAGMTTGELDAIAEEHIRSQGATPSFLGYHGFTGSLCVSVNDEVVHGIPGPRQLRDGDVVTLDLALMLEGYCADTATTVAVGKVDPQVQKLLDVTMQTLAMAVNNMKPGRRWTDLARLMQYHVESNGFSVVREFVGHGIGRNMHEDPKVANFVTAEQLRGDFKLRPGMTLAVEPMVVMGKRDVDLMPDNWTVRTKDGAPAAHFEHTVAVTEDGADILTDGRAPWGL